MLGTDPGSSPAIVASLTALQSLLPTDVPWRLVLIPPITGVIGYVTNWVGIRLLFHPVDFVGVRVPGVAQFARLLPAKLQSIPGVAEGKLGWQGIVPSRAAKMGSLAADNGVKQIATQGEFYQQFDPDAIADHVVTTAGDDIHDLVDEIVRREHPAFWADLPAPVREAVHARVDAKLPEITARLTREIGEHIDDLLDMKLMIINHLEANPRLLNRIFLEVGEKELQFLVNSGFVLGTLLGCVSIPLFVFVDAWWVLPVSGVLVGYFTNYIAVKAIFDPTEPRKIGPFTLQGLFIKRQREASATYADVIADDVITLSNIARNLLTGAKSDRTRKLIADALRPAVDEAVGIAGPLVRVTTGDREYEAIRESLATEAVDLGFEPLDDDAFNEARSDAIRELITERMQALPPEDYVVMLRSAFEEDEWLLIGIGAALGFVAGWIQLLMVTAI
jgi:uncharacterized membrane protein YheB (UPF0754 family)